MASDKTLAMVLGVLTLLGVLYGTAGQWFDMKYRVQRLEELQRYSHGNLDAFVAGLAARLARNWAPALYQMRKMDWEEAWQEVITLDQPDDTYFITPGLSSYYY